MWKAFGFPTSSYLVEQGAKLTEDWRRGALSFLRKRFFFFFFLVSRTGDNLLRFVAELFRKKSSFRDGIEHSFTGALKIIHEVVTFFIIFKD